MSLTTHQKRLTAVIKTIEQQLDKDINCQQLADIACYSKYHFHRVFRSFTGQNVYAYRKRLLLERSLKHLLYSNDSITTIALNCGYETASAFNKAFKANFSISPSEARRQAVSISLTSIKRQLKDLNMTPEIKTLQDTEVTCARANGNYAKAAAEAWEIIMQYAYSNRLMDKAVQSIGISYDDPNITDPEFIRYDACLTLNKKASEDSASVFKQVIAGGNYAMFLHKGAYEELANTYQYIFSHWLPKQTFKLRDVPCFEKYLNRDPRRTKPENLRTEIYIPIE